MKTWHTFLVVPAVLFIGCETKIQRRVDSKPSPETKAAATSTPEDQPLTDKQKVALLRQEAHAMGLKWHVFCVDWNKDANKQFMGEATPKDASYSFYIEDGGKGVWLVYGATQADAAYALYQSIQGAQTYPAEHKEKEKEHKHKVCPPELSGQ